MARNATADSAEDQVTDTEDQAADGTQTESTGEQATDSKPKDRAPLMISLPTELHKLLTDKAKAGNIAVSALARNVLAKDVGFTIPADFGTRAPKRKYATAEDREKAQKDRYETAKLLMAAFNSGKIPQEILDAMKAARGESAAEPAEAPAS